MSRVILFVLVLWAILLPQTANSQNENDLTLLFDSLEQAETPAQQSRLYISLADAYLFNNLDTALQFASLAAAVAMANEDLLYYKALYMQGQVFYYMRNLDSCFICLDRILLREPSIRDQAFLGDVYQLYGTAMNGARRLVIARKKHMRALEFYQLGSDTTGQAAVYNSLSILYKSQGQYDSAAFYAVKSLRMVETIEDRVGIVKAHGNLGKIFINLKDYDRAKAYFLKGYEEVRKIDHKRFEALILANLGIVNFFTEQQDSALFYYFLALEIETTTGNLTGEAFLYGNIGAVYDQLKKYDRAMDYFRKAYSIHVKLDDRSGIVGGKSNIALMYERKGDYHKALLIYDTVLQLAREFNFPNDIAQTYRNIYATYELMGDYKKAFEYKSLYHEIQDSLTGLEKDTRINSLLIEYGKEQDQAEILSLKNITLEQELEIKKKTNQRNIYSLLGLSIAIAILMVYLVKRQQMIKDRQIRLKEIERLNEEKKAMAARALVEGQEEERKRVATELHDGIGVLLSSAKLQFTNIEETLPEKREQFEKATSLLEKAAGDIRRISHNLMPGNLVRFGLTDALEDLFESINDSGTLQAEIEVKGVEERLPENHEIMLYRIVQELLNNTLKHASANKIALLVTKDEQMFRMHYTDNGVGFAVAELADSGSLGLKSIRSRIDFLEGDLQIESAPGQGASFRIEIPVKK